MAKKKTPAPEAPAAEDVTADAVLEEEAETETAEAAHCDLARPDDAFGATVYSVRVGARNARYLCETFGFRSTQTIGDRIVVVANAEVYAAYCKARGITPTPSVRVL